jgi:hypothetical protein
MRVWLLAVLLFPGCSGGEPSPEAGIVTRTLPARTGPKSAALAMVVTRVDPQPMSGGVVLPITWTALGSNIYLMTALPPVTAASRVLADRLAQTAALVTPWSGSTLLPADAIAWMPWPGPDHRRVLVDAVVVFREGYLEHLLTRHEAGKNHESILSASFDAEHLHLALLAAGAQPGHPARFVNERQELAFTPATGDPIAVVLRYLEENGTERWVPAQSWVLNALTRRPLDRDWVFAGSYRGSFEEVTGEKRTFYAANEGRIICLTNFSSALLDLPVESKDASPESGGLDYIANSAVIPPLGMRVSVFLIPKKGPGSGGVSPPGAKPTVPENPPP